MCSPPGSLCYLLSKYGVPNVVNSLATHCLIYAFQKGELYVDEEAGYQASNKLSV